MEESRIALMDSAREVSGLTLAGSESLSERIRSLVRIVFTAMFIPAT
jgi:hypothetical protein